MISDGSPGPWFNFHVPKRLKCCSAATRLHVHLWSVSLSGHRCHRDILGKHRKTAKRKVEAPRRCQEMLVRRKCEKNRSHGEYTYNQLHNIKASWRSHQSHFLHPKIPSSQRLGLGAGTVLCKIQGSPNLASAPGPEDKGVSFQHSHPHLMGSPAQHGCNMAVEMAILSAKLWPF